MSDSGEMEYRAFKMIIDSSKEELGIHDCRKWGGFLYTCPKKSTMVAPTCLLAGCYSGLRQNFSNLIVPIFFQPDTGICVNC
jgi:hypothetical protein